MKTTVKAVQHITQRFPAEAGSELADVILDPANEYDYESEDFTVNLQGLTAEILISAYFGSLMTKLHEKSVQLAIHAASSWNWLTQHEFQQENISRWMEPWTRLAGDVTRRLVSLSGEMPIEYQDLRRLRLKYSFSPNTLARYYGPQNPNAVLVEVMSYVAPPAIDVIEKWKTQGGDLPQPTVIIRTTPNDPTTVKEVEAHTLERLPHEFEKQS